MKGTKYSVEECISRAFVFAMRDKDFVALSPVLMVGTTKVIKDAKDWPSPMRSAYTNGRDVRIWHEYADGLTEPELRFVLFHESYHKAYRHMTIWAHLFKRNPVATNMAADYRINADLKRLGNANISMPDGCLYDAKYDDPALWDTKRIYDDLLKNGKGKGSGKCNGNCQPSNGHGGQPNGQCTCPQGFDEHGWGEAEEMTADEQRQLAQDIDQALRQGSLLAGKMGANIDRSLEDLIAVKRDWKQDLREFLTTFTRGSDQSTWQRPSRRHIAQDMYMPSTLSESMGEMVIAVDASGSVSQQLLTYFLSHVCRIMETIKPIKVNLIWWDGEVGSHQVYEPHQYDTLKDTVRVVGGGGTTVSCVSRFLNKNKIKPECILILTDGFLGSDYGSHWPAQVLWAIQGADDFSPPNGKVIQLPEDLS